MKLQNELSNTRQLVAEKEVEIANLKTQLDDNGSPTPSNPSPVPQDCTKCLSTVDQQSKLIQELQNQNKELNDRLNDCPGLLKRCGRKAAGSSVVNKGVSVQ